MIFATIHEAWRHGCGEYCNPEFGHFMVIPVRITERGTKTLVEMVENRQETCALAKENEPWEDKYRMRKWYPHIIADVCPLRGSLRAILDSLVSSSIICGGLARSLGTGRTWKSTPRSHTTQIAQEAASMDVIIRVLAVEVSSRNNRSKDKIIENSGSIAALAICLLQTISFAASLRNIGDDAVLLGKRPQKRFFPSSSLDAHTLGSRFFRTGLQEMFF
jgi:hypothetical protein